MDLSSLPMNQDLPERINPVFNTAKTTLFQLASAGDRDAIHIADQPGLTPEGTQDDATSEQAETIREAEIRKARMNDLSRIAEIQVFNYRLYFLPCFQIGRVLL